MPRVITIVAGVAAVYVGIWGFHVYVNVQRAEKLCNVYLQSDGRPKAFKVSVDQTRFGLPHLTTMTILDGNTRLAVGQATSFYGTFAWLHPRAWPLTSEKQGYVYVEKGMAVWDKDTYPLLGYKSRVFVK